MGSGKLLGFVAGRIRQRDRADIYGGLGIGLTCLASAFSSYYMYD